VFRETWVFCDVAACRLANNYRKERCSGSIYSVTFLKASETYLGLFNLADGGSAPLLVASKCLTVEGVQRPIRPVSWDRAYPSKVKVSRSKFYMFYDNTCFYPLVLSIGVFDSAVGIASCFLPSEYILRFSDSLRNCRKKDVVERNSAVV